MYTFVSLFSDDLSVTQHSTNHEHLHMELHLKNIILVILINQMLPTKLLSIPYLNEKKICGNTVELGYNEIGGTEQKFSL